MIIEYDEKGEIFHIISDPVNQSVLEMMLARESGVLNLPPVPAPLEHEKDWDTGELRYNDDGSPKMVSNRVINQECDILADYILDGAVTPRPVFDLPDQIELVADGVDSRTINVPDPCEIRVDGQPMTVSNLFGDLTLSSDMPAEYTLELVQWPYMAKTIKVIARAAD
ncbi:hypothetical protein BPNPMPFG_002521 [Mesorhizobium sp. AR07]|uniref:hypothetical protein n=1 Tax=Mesorhizobium sp. AR07 TaxID=2865838 RepID=UPI002160A5F8|nr:hypothetical protein [Mesorhizobium sp. AR07]UVK46811.1 hypothetical protein BPNPMPFG_002521 [Mesorhizobium sp. AR07]